MAAILKMVAITKIHEDQSAIYLRECPTKFGEDPRRTFKLWCK